jgi:outer membrane protein OmpA-like peptidoglycan-associated protein
LITGHTDNRGELKKNIELSRNRANNIKKFISQNEVSISRIESLGLGDLTPIDTNRTEEGRKRNRRVEFVLLYKN